MEQSGRDVSQSGLYDCEDAKYDSITENAYQQERRKMNPNEQLMDAIERGDLNGVMRHVQEGANPNTYASLHI